jgi:hypothetical protein
MVDSGVRVMFHDRPLTSEEREPLCDPRDHLSPMGQLNVSDLRKWVVFSPRDQSYPALAAAFA